MTSWCPRCGYDRAEDALLPCDMCWDHRGDGAFVAQLIELITAGRPGTLRLLGDIGDPEAAAALAEACQNGHPPLRAAAARGLGWSGSERDVPLLASLARDRDEKVRIEAVDSLAEIGGQAAADTLAALLPETPARDARLAQLNALSWLRDPRALPEWHALVDEVILDDRQGAPRGVVWALLRTGEEADRVVLEDAFTRLVQRDLSARGSWSSLAVRVFRDLWSRMLATEPSHAQAFLDKVTAIDPAAPTFVPTRIPSSFEILEPIGERTVARRAFARELLASPPDTDVWPPARFGGRPDWRGAPDWPRTEEGRPFVMIAQLPLDPANARTGYVFVNLDWDARTFDPWSGDSRLIVQSGPVTDAARVQEDGPVLHHTVVEPRYRSRHRYLPYERWPSLEPGHDPREWEWPEVDPKLSYGDDFGDWAKIGGTPLWLQGDDTPEGDWRFAFQFGADWAGHEMGDGAECYGFVGDDDRGLFLWQCH